MSFTPLFVGVCSDFNTLQHSDIKTNVVELVHLGFPHINSSHSLHQVDIKVTMNTELMCEELPTDHGIRLGDGFAHTGFPQPRAATVQDLQDNILYCKLKLQRLDATVTLAKPGLQKYSIRVSLAISRYEQCLQPL